MRASSRDICPLYDKLVAGHVPARDKDTRLTVRHHEDFVSMF